MDDVFKREISRPLEEGVDPLAALERVEKRMHAAVDDLQGTTFAEPFRCTDQHGSNFSRPTLAALIDVIEDRHLELKYIYRVVGTRNNPPRPECTVDTTLWFSSSTIKVEIAGTSEVIVNGLARAAEEALERTSSPLAASSTPGPGVQPTPDGAPTPSAPVGTPTPGMQPSEHDAGWLRTTWRDHTATFIVTVIGTVLAGLILARLFGVGS